MVLFVRLKFAFLPAALETVPDFEFIAVNPLMRLLLPSSIGLLLRARARLSGSEPELSSLIEGGEVTRRFARAADRVTGPK